MMRAVFFALVISAPACALAAGSPLAAAEQHPGYGVVQSITPLRIEPAEESASAGSSAPAERAGNLPGKTSYLARIKLDDGSIQIRQLKKPDVARGIAVGSRVLVTNAGDVLPE